MRSLAVLLLVLLFTLLFPGAAAAHKPSDAYLSLSVEGRAIQGRWDLALRDLEHAIGLDRDGDGAITWGELKARHAAIAAYALARLELSSAGEACPSEPVEQLVEEHSDGAYAVLRFVAGCSAPVSELDLSYSLLFDLDPLHRGLVQIEHRGATHTGVLSPEQPSLRVTPEEPELLRQFLTFLWEGVWHIWIGIDHILFLISLLLPAVLRRRPASWEPVESFGEALVETVKVVTAFTLAHSITLSLAALGVLSLPSRLIESVIAASVVVAALNNLYPVITRKVWLVAFGFGLVHGFGFASVLADLGLPQDALLLALFGFNLGVELGQLAIVAAFMPLAFALRQSWLYRRVALQAGSVVIAAIAMLWLVERALGVALVIT
jgi:HupE / UreJ protein